MDDVTLTRPQLKRLLADAEKQKDSMCITGKHEELDMIYVEPTKKRGRNQGKWITREGRDRDASS